MQPNICAVTDETSSSSSSSSFSPSSSSVKVAISKTTTNKRKSMLTVNGYAFQMKAYNKAKTIKFLVTICHVLIRDIFIIEDIFLKDIS